MKTNFITLFRPENIVERKSTLFSIVVIGVVAILTTPIIIPHLLHGYHIAHIFLHIGGLTLAVFISVLASIAYYRHRTKRLFFSAAAFLTFICGETVFLIDTTWPTAFDVGDMPLQEIGHILIFTTLGLLALGVFRDD